MEDLEFIQSKFEKARDEVTSKLAALIDKRLAVLRKIVPGASYTDAMGSNHLFDSDSESQRDDPVYLAMELVLDPRRRPATEEDYGEPLPDFEKKAALLFERHADIIREILEIGEYLSNEVGGAYG